MRPILPPVLPYATKACSLQEGLPFKTHVGLIMLLTLFELTTKVTVESFDVHLVTSDHLSYQDAVAECRSLGYDGLTMPNTAEKYDILKNITWSFRQTSHEKFWIGMRYYEERQLFVWDNGVPISWVASKWGHNFPANLPEHQCVRLKPNGNIANTGCDRQHYSVCEKYDTFNNEFAIVATDTSSQDGLSSVLWAGKARSQVECGYMCMKDQTCKYIVYSGSTLHCQTLTRNFSLPTDTVPADGVIIYDKFP